MRNMITRFSFVLAVFLSLIFVVNSSVFAQCDPSTETLYGCGEYDDGTTIHPACSPEAVAYWSGGCTGAGDTTYTHCVSVPPEVGVDGNVMCVGPQWQPAIEGCAACGYDVTSGNCTVTFDPTVYYQNGNWLLPIRAPADAPAGAAACGVGCSTGSVCVTDAHDFFGGHTIGSTYSGYCADYDNLCCGRTPVNGDPSTGGACNEVAANGTIIPCCNNEDTCYQPDPTENGRCQTCANLSGGFCQSDSECCTETPGVSLACNITTRTCQPQPDEPERSICNPSLFAVGATCDVGWYTGDELLGSAPGLCDRCIGGPTAYLATNCTGTGAGMVCDHYCTGLDDGETCTVASSCACESNICADDGTGNFVCGAVGSCVSGINQACNESNTSTTDDCCANSSGGEPLACLMSGGSTTCISPACTYTPPSVGSACTSIAECCPSSTGLTCDGSSCVASTAIGFECDQEGACETGACDYGQMCVNGYCTSSDDCIAVYAMKEYTGPIIDFNDFVNRIFLFLYPVGIVLGLFFIGKSGYTIMTSEGNPQKIQEGKDELTSAVLGTLFIILSLVILRVIIRALLGADILN